MIGEVLQFIEQKTGVRANPDSDLFELGIAGDDFHELIEAYAQQFGVSIEPYLWYFHADEEGINFGALFFRPPYCRVKRIPITPLMLVDFAQKGTWDVQYPPHTIPKTRIDLLISTCFVALMALFVCTILIFKYLQ
jgi:hypothetical protein